jgi:hypothetical protein
MDVGDNHHELVGAFASSGLPLSENLTEMLNEHFSHCTERRGCGYLQGSRVVAVQVNNAAGHNKVDGLDKLFALPLSTELLSYINNKYSSKHDVYSDVPDESLCRAQTEVFSVDNEWRSRLRGLPDRMLREENRLLAGMMIDLVLSDATGEFLSIKSLTDKPPVGSCTLAEKFFMDIAHGLVPRRGRINIIVDHADRPIFMEKVKIGDSHSCISLQPVLMNGVRIPEGSLFSTRHRSDEEAMNHRLCRNGRGHVISVSAYEGFRFLRITTLSLPPEIRKRAFGAFYEWQRSHNYAGFDSLRLSVLADIAKQQI